MQISVCVKALLCPKGEIRGIAGRGRFGFIHFEMYSLEDFVQVLMTDQL
jgi:hypothetical protein